MVEIPAALQAMYDEVDANIDRLLAAVQTENAPPAMQVYIAGMMRQFRRDIALLTFSATPDPQMMSFCDILGSILSNMSQRDTPSQSYDVLQQLVNQIAASANESLNDALTHQAIRNPLTH